VRDHYSIFFALNKVYESLHDDLSKVMERKAFYFVKSYEIFELAKFPEWRWIIKIFYLEGYFLLNQSGLLHQRERKKLFYNSVQYLKMLKTLKDGLMLWAGYHNIKCKDNCWDLSPLLLKWKKIYENWITIL